MSDFALQSRFFYQTDIVTNSQTSIYPPSDADLLKEFCELGSEAAFQALVEKRLGLVLSAVKDQSFVGTQAAPPALAETISHGLLPLRRGQAARQGPGAVAVFRRVIE
jgi:hypothetical protein